MNKEEILAKNRKENDLSDERTKYIRLKGDNFSISVMIFLWIVILKFTPLDEVAKYAMGWLVNATCLSNFIYQFIKIRTKTAIFFTILFFIATAIYLLLFLKVGIKVF